MSRIDELPEPGTMIIMIEVPPGEYNEEHFQALFRGTYSLGKLFFAGAWIHYHRYITGGWKGELGPEFFGRTMDAGSDAAVSTGNSDPDHAVRDGEREGGDRVRSTAAGRNRWSDRDPQGVGNYLPGTESAPEGHTEPVEGGSQPAPRHRKE